MTQTASETTAATADSVESKNRVANSGPASIASPHFQFARRTSDIGYASRHAHSSQSLPDDALRLVGSNEPRYRLDQVHPPVPATHLPRSVVEQFVGWSEVVTTTWTASGPESAPEPARPAARPGPVAIPIPPAPLAPAPTVTAEALEAVRRTADMQAAMAAQEVPEQSLNLAMLPATRLEPVVAEGSLAGSAFALKPAPFGQALPSGSKDESATSAVRSLSLDFVGAGRENKSVAGSGQEKAVPIARETAPLAAPSFDLDDIPLFPEPAWPLVSELLLGAGWPFTSRLADGMARALAGRSNTVLFTGVQRAVGTTTLCLTLARWAATQRKVLVVDADVPACGLTRLLGKDPVRSWPAVGKGRDFVTTGLIRSSRTGIAFATLTPIRNRQLWPPFLLDRLGELLVSVGTLFDLVLVDAGPVSQLAGELTACAALTPCAMVVSGGDASEEPLIQSAHRRLGELGAERILAARNFSARPLRNAG